MGTGWGKLGVFKEVHTKVLVARGEAVGGRVCRAGREAGAWEGCEKGSGELMEALTGSFWKAAAGRRG